MYNLSNLPTTEQFARSLAETTEQQCNAFEATSSLLLRAPISVSDISNGTNAQNPQNANFVLGVGHSHLPVERGAFNVRGLNSNRQNSSFVLARVPGQNAITWMVVQNS